MTAPGRGPGGARCRRAARSSRWSRVRRARARSSWTSAARSSSRPRGSPSTGRDRSASRPACSRASQPPSIWRSRCRAASTSRSSSATSGTTSLAASVGVEARTSATRSSSGWSCSWPIAETTGVRSPCTARISASSENGSRSSTEPPPRATTMTSTSGWRSSRAERLHHLGGGALALHGGVGDLEGDVRPAAPGVVEHVALGGRLGRGDQPDPVGEERQRPLELAGEQPLGREQLPAPLEPGQQLAEADHPDLADRERERAAVGVVGRLGQHHHAGALDQRRRPGCRRCCAGRSAAPRCRPRRRAAS